MGLITKRKKSYVKERIYLRVGTGEQDLTRQAAIEHNTREAGHYIAGVYGEKASGNRGLTGM